MIYTTRETCRSCNSPHLMEVLSLGQTYVSDFIDADAPNEGPLAPLDLVLCPDCSLVQLRHTTNPDLLWRHYWYRSGTNQTMRTALAEICGRASEVARLQPSDLVLDIGCNDGTLLRAYPGANLRRVGFEPAENLLADARVGTTAILHDFFNWEAFQRTLGDTKAKVITAISMFYDLENPNQFVSDVRKCLADDGLWVIQMNYLLSMLKTNAFDNILHEHLEYYSLTSLRGLLERHELEIFDVELNDLNGGSFRVYVKHKGASVLPRAGAIQRLHALQEEEDRFRLTSRAVYDDFARRVNTIARQVSEFVRQEHRSGKVICVYGASTRGSTLLQFLGLDHRTLLCAAERSPYKCGKKTTGTWIPIVSEEEARAQRPDYFLVLPYFFQSEFVEREKDFLESGGKFIFPLPHFEVVGGKVVEAAASR